MNETAEPMRESATDPHPMTNSDVTIGPAIFWILFPFVLLMVWFAGLRIYETQRAINELYANAEALVGKISSNPGADRTALIDEMVRTAGFSEADKESATSYRRLLRVINYRLVSSGETPNAFLSDIVNTTSPRLYSQIFGIFFLQAVLVFYFPGMLIQSVRQAAQEIRDPSTFDGFIRGKHNDWLCHKECEKLLWRRGLFAWLIIISVAYVFAPGGFTHAAQAGFVYLYSPPTEPSLLVWFEQFLHIPAVLCGMAGFLLYSFTTFINQSRDGTLSYATLAPLINRGIVVAVLGLLLTAFGDGSSAMSALAFLVGVFPQTGVAAMATLAATGRPPVGNGSDFEELQEINYSRELALKEADVTSLDELAKTDVVKLATETGIKGGVVLDLVDRSILLHAINEKTANTLAEIPVLRATDFMHYWELNTGDLNIQEVSGLKEPMLLYNRLKRDAKHIVEIRRRWEL
jgi:hypothetical protein